MLQTDAKNGRSTRKCMLLLAATFSAVTLLGSARAEDVQEQLKKLFRVTAKGVSAVNRTQRALLSMTEGLDLARRYS